VPPLPPTRPPARRRRRVAAVAALALGGALLAPMAPAGAAVTAFPVTGRVSVTDTGAQLGGAALGRTLIDASGRFVAFGTSQPAGPGDTNGALDVYVRDRLAGRTTRVSVTDDEGQVGGSSQLCGLSDDARFVVFVANAANLPGGATTQTYVRDRQLATTSIVSVSSAEVVGKPPTGVGGSSAETTCAVSNDGRYVAFDSSASNLVAGDTLGHRDVFRRDRQAGTTARISVASAGGQANGPSSNPAMDDTGAVLFFESVATNIDAFADTNGATDIFARIPTTPVTLRLSVGPNNVQATADSTRPAVSGDGQILVYETDAPNIVADDDNGVADIVIYDRVNGTRELASVASNGAQALAVSAFASVSQDGRYVGFSSWATNLYPLDGNQSFDAFVHDRTLARTDLASRTSGLAPGNDGSGYGASVSSVGPVAAFTSTASDLVRSDTNGSRDVFTRAFRVDVAPFTSFDAFVAQQHQDFAGRAPTAAELASWRARLVNGEVSPEQVVTALAHSAAWSQHRGPVARLYWSFFLRPPDAPGLAHWVAQRAAGASLPSIAAKFAASNEFKTTYGPLSNAEFVDLVYENILERDPDAAGLSYWTGQLASGAKSRGDVMVGFSESSEGRAFLAPQVDVVLVHLGLLRTLPGAGPFAVLTEELDDGTALEVVVAALRTSPAYLDRF
jgi:hypothetical protein